MTYHPDAIPLFKHTTLVETSWQGIEHTVPIAPVLWYVGASKRIKGLGGARQGERTCCCW
jgi:hypothetical protein